MIFIGGGGMDPAAMMVGMAMGSTLGRHMAGTMNNIMDNMQQPVVPAPARAPLQPHTAPPHSAPPLMPATPPPVLPAASLPVNPAVPVAPLSSQISNKENTMQIYDEKNFYSLDRLMEFGMSTNIAQQMVNNMNHHIQNMFIPGPGNTMRLQQNSGMPPVQEIQVIPEPVYYALIDGKQSGPYCETELARLINEKKLTKETYIWFTGINEWIKAENIPTIIRLVALAPPPPPEGVV